MLKSTECEEMLLFFQSYLAILI